MNQIKDAVAQRFQELCHERQISYNALANLAGVTPSTVYSLMNPQRRDVSINTIKVLCDGLDISLDTFFDAEHFHKLEQSIK